MHELLPFPRSSPQAPAPSDVGSVVGRQWPHGLTTRSVIGLALTSLLSGALLLVLLVRLIAAGQMVASVAPYPLVGHPAPDFTVALWNGQQSGEKLHLADLKGKAVVVNFWASWCASCTLEMPTLESAYKQYAAKGVVFVGLAFNDTAEQGKPFLQQYGITYPSGPDASGEISVAYGVTGVPETVFIGRDGRIVSKSPGGVDASSLASGLVSIVKG